MKFDQFESVFRSAIKQRYSFRAPTVDAVLVVTDQARPEAEATLAAVRRLHAGLERLGDATWHLVAGVDFEGIDALLKRLDEVSAGLVVTWRNVFGRATDSRHALGSVLETLTQSCHVPVLVLPSDGTDRQLPSRERVDRVLVVTDHLTGARRLVDWGLLLTPDQGTIYLAHIEDEAIFERYMEAIGRIPSMDTDRARDRLAAKLLQMPQDYIDSVVKEMVNQEISEAVVPIVRMGHPLRQYEALLVEHDIDLVIIHGKDDKQQAMHGTAHALAVEVARTPVLML